MLTWLLIGDDAADRLRVAEMPIRAQRGRDRVADAQAVPHLLDRAGLMLAEHLQRRVAIRRGLRGHDLGVARARHIAPRVAHGVAELRPGRHGLAGLVGVGDARLGVETGRHGQVTRGRFQRVGTTHGDTPDCA
jgi:hypothetical protein